MLFAFFGNIVLVITRNNLHISARGSFVEKFPWLSFRYSRFVLEMSKSALKGEKKVWATFEAVASSNWRFFRRNIFHEAVDMRFWRVGDDFHGNIRLIGPLFTSCGYFPVKKANLFQWSWLIDGLACNWRRCWLSASRKHPLWKASTWLELISSCGSTAFIKSIWLKIESCFKRFLITCRLILGCCRSKFFVLKYLVTHSCETFSENSFLTFRESIENEEGTLNFETQRSPQVLNLEFSEKSKHFEFQTFFHFIF